MHGVVVHYNNDKDCREWCTNNLAQDQWYVKFGVRGSGCSYWFRHDQDRLAFVLAMNHLSGMMTQHDKQISL